MAFFRRLWNWCKRFRYRCGYGVHSPSDFFLITSVVYESLPYYAYRELESSFSLESSSFYRRKVNRLLFRLVNYFQPACLVNVAGEDDWAFRYMKAACTSMKTNDVRVHDMKKTLQAVENIKGGVDMLHVGNTPFYSEVVEKIIPYMNTDACMIVGGIYTSEEKKKWWKQLKNDERVRITFDLYDIGIVLFDPKRYKQNYIVNFF